MSLLKLLWGTYDNKHWIICRQIDQDNHLVDAYEGGGRQEYCGFMKLIYKSYATWTTFVKIA